MRYAKSLTPSPTVAIKLLWDAVLSRPFLIFRSVDAGLSARNEDEGLLTPHKRQLQQFKRAAITVLPWPDQALRREERWMVPGPEALFD